MGGLMLEVEPFLEFLGAQLDEDERVAQAADDEGESPWTINHDRRVPDDEDVYLDTGTRHSSSLGGWTVTIGKTCGCCTAGAIAPPFAEHIVRNHPRRVLREVEGIRQIIHKAVQYEQDGASPGGNVFGYHATGLFTALRHIAEARYADRPGYRDAWRP